LTLVFFARYLLRADVFELLAGRSREWGDGCSCSPLPPPLESCGQLRHWVAGCDLRHRCTSRWLGRPLDAVTVSVED
jgi:hypothetical protein